MGTMEKCIQNLNWETRRERPLDGGRSGWEVELSWHDNIKMCPEEVGYILDWLRIRASGGLLRTAW
jgi:hypothetical protein